MNGYDFGTITPEAGLRYLYIWHETTVMPGMLTLTAAAKTF